MGTGPVVIAFDGSPEAQTAVRQAGALLSGKPALVVTVWKAGLGFELLSLPASSVGLPPAQLDVRTALAVDQAQMERARTAAEHGSALARDAGFGDTDGVAVADDPDVPVAETVVSVARERDAQAIVIPTHDDGPGALLEATPRDVIRLAPCPVVVVSPRAASG